MTSTSSNSEQTGSWPKRVLSSRPFQYVAAAVVVLVAIERIHEHVQSEAIRERLIGRWTYARDGSPVDNYVFIFRPDGLVRIYPLGSPETKEQDKSGGMEWTVDGGVLVLSYRNFFPRDASIPQRVRQLWALVRERIKGNQTPVVDSGRWFLDDPGGNTITIQSHPDKLPGHSWVRQNWKLTRAEEGAGDAQQARKPPGKRSE